MYQDKKKLVFAPRFWGKILANFTYFVLYIHTNICIKITEVNNNTFVRVQHIWEKCAVYMAKLFKGL